MADRPPEVERDERLSAAAVQFHEARARVWDELSYLLHTHGRDFARGLVGLVERFGLGGRCHECDGSGHALRGAVSRSALCATCHGRGWCRREGPR